MQVLKAKQGSSQQYSSQAERDTHLKKHIKQLKQAALGQEEQLQSLRTQEEDLGTALNDLASVSALPGLHPGLHPFVLCCVNCTPATLDWCDDVALFDCCVLGVLRCPEQELGDRNQLVARLTEQINEAEAAFQAAKAQRNGAQDVRKAAWQREAELKEQVKKVEDDYHRAYTVSTAAMHTCPHHLNQLSPTAAAAAATLFAL